MKLFADALKKGNRTEYMWKIRKRNKQVYNCYTALVFGVLSVAIPAVSFSAPTGGEIVAGTGSIGQQGLNTNINQGSQKLDINWQTFSTNTNEAVNFFQPNSDAVAVNYVIGGVPSQLKGALNANGNVFILNDSGITFYGTSKVNVGSLVATTAKNVTIDENGKANFSNIGNASVINSGDITVSDGGFAVLAAPRVENLGTIKANLGRVELAGTNGGYAVDLRGDGLITFGVSEGAANSLLVSNQGSITAKSGTVNITTQQANDVVSNVINLAGVVDANALGATDNGGTVLVKSGGSINTAGVVSANATQGNGGKAILFADAVGNFDGKVTTTSESGKGGFIETSGKYVDFGENFSVDAGKGGHWLIDPINITINSALASTIVGQLATADVTVDTNNAPFGGAGGDQGDITVTSAINWNSAFSLSLLANDDITVNAGIDNDGTGGLTLDAGNGGGNNITISGNISLAGGNFLATAGGAIDANNTIANTGAGNVTLDAGGTIDIDNAISLVDGNFLADTDGTININNNVTASGLGGITFIAGGNVNSDTTAANRSITTTSGNISITGDDVTLQGTRSGGGNARNLLVQTTSGNIDITANGAFDLSRTHNSAGTAKILSDTGNISVTTTAGSNRNITIDDRDNDKAVVVKSNSGNITLTADDNVSVTDTALVQATNGDGSITAGGDVTIDDGSFVYAAQGFDVTADDINVDASTTTGEDGYVANGIELGNLTVRNDNLQLSLNFDSGAIKTGNINALAGADVNVSVNGNGASIDIGDVSVTNQFLTVGDIIVTANGLGNSIETGVLSSNFGSITVETDDGEGVDGDSINVAGITSQYGNIEVNGAGENASVTVGNVSTGDTTVIVFPVIGNVDITANNTGGKVTTGSVSTTKGDIDISANSVDGAVNAGDLTTTNGGTITVLAGNGLAVDNEGEENDLFGIVLGNVSIGDGELNVTALNSGDVKTGDLTATSGDLNVSGFDITAGNITTNDGALNFSVDSIGGGFTAGDISATVTNVDVTAGAGGINVGNVVNNTDNSIRFYSNEGSVTTGNLTTTTGSITLGTGGAETADNITAGDVTTDSGLFTANAGEGGEIGGDLFIGDITVKTSNIQSFDGSYGLAGKDITTGVLTSGGAGIANAGDITINAFNDLTVGGVNVVADITNSNESAYASEYVSLQAGNSVTVTGDILVDVNASSIGSEGGNATADADFYVNAPTVDLEGTTTVNADAFSADDSAYAYADISVNGTTINTGSLAANADALDGSASSNAYADAYVYVSGTDVTVGDVSADADADGLYSADAFADIYVYAGNTVETGSLTVAAAADASSYADAEANLDVTGSEGVTVNGNVNVTANTLANYAYSEGSESDSPEGDFAYADVNVQAYDGNTSITGNVDVSATGTANEDEGIAKAFLFAGAGTEGSGDLSIEGNISVAANATGGSFEEGDDTYGYGAFATAEAELSADGNITLGTEEGGGDVNVLATADGNLTVYTDTAFFGESSSETYTNYEAPSGYANANLDIYADSAEGDSDIVIHGDVNVDATATNVTGYNSSYYSSYYSYAAAEADVEITTERGDITIDGNVQVAASATTTATSTEVTEPVQVAGSSTEGTEDDVFEDPADIVTNLPVGDIEADAELSITANGEWVEGGESSEGSFEGGNVQIGNGVTVTATAETGYEASADAYAEIDADANVNVDGTVSVAATANGSSSADASASFNVYAGQDTGAGSVTLDGVIVTADAELANSSEGASSIEADASVDIHAANDVTIDGDVLIVAGATINNVEVESSAEASANLHVRAGAFRDIEQYTYSYSYSGETYYSYYSSSVDRTSENGGSVTINGNVELQANVIIDGGSVESSAEADADAEIEAANDVTITGDVTVAALVQNNDGYVDSSAEASADFDVYAGKEFGEGSSEFSPEEEQTGSILINGNINVDATAEVNSGGYMDSSNSADADVRLFAANDVTVNGNIRVNAAAEVNGTEESNAFAYSNDADAELYIYAGGYEGAAAYGDGSVNITGDVDVLATAAVSENASADYNSASADAEIYAANDVNITGNVNVAALAQGGMSSEGYDYANGSASAELDISAGDSEGGNGDVFVDGDITVLAKEDGVVPQEFDDAYASVDVRGSNVTVTGDVTAYAENDATGLYGSEYNDEIAAYAEVLITAFGTEEYIEGEEEEEGEYVFTPGNIELGGNVIATALTTIPEESSWYQDAQAFINVDAGENGAVVYGEETTLTATAGNLVQVGEGSQENSNEGTYEYAEVLQTPDVPSSTSSSSSGGGSGSGSSSGGSSSGGSSSGGEIPGGSSSGGASSGGTSSGGSGSSSSSGGNDQVNNLINVLVSQLGKGNRNVTLTDSTQLGSLEPAAGGELGGADGEFCGVVNCAGIE